MTGKDTLSQVLARFAAGLEWEHIPPAVRERAKLLLIDAVGVAFASTRFDFARRTLSALQLMAGGDSDVIGMPEKLALRDAALMNGILVHGLDYDDTYLPGSVHLTASSVPASLGVAAARGASGKDLLTACTLAASARRNAVLLLRLDGELAHLADEAHPFFRSRMSGLRAVAGPHGGDCAAGRGPE